MTKYVSLDGVFIVPAGGADAAALADAMQNVSRWTGPDADAEDRRQIAEWENGGREAMHAYLDRVEAAQSAESAGRSSASALCALKWYSFPLTFAE